jgi:predicted TPR repeat methyltransferase
MTDLENAYALNGPQDCARLYADWAASYDAGFASNMDYRLPAHVAAAFLAHGGSGPILDVGAGTGLLAEHLRASGCTSQIDALDLSPEMLAIAARKRLYSGLFAADVTLSLNLPHRYAGITSSGTFTHGHVGPAALDQLEQIALPGALFALSINAGVYTAMGFDAALARRPDVTLIETAIYGAQVKDPAHAQDRALIALWRHQG